MPGQKTVFVIDGFTSQSLAAVRSLGRSGWRVIAPSGSISGASRFVERRVALPRSGPEPRAFLAAVREVVSAENVDVIFPCEDLSVELWYADRQADGGPGVAAAARASAERFVDKAETLAAADAAGFPTPRWLAPTTIEEGMAFVRELGLPCVLKSRRSYKRVGGAFVHRRHVIPRTPAAAESALRAAGDDDLPVVQEYVPGRALGVAALVVDGRFVARVARETFSYNPIAGGDSVWLRTVPPDAVGVQEAFALLRDVGFEGLGDVQYQVDASGIPRLMEIGVRVNAWADVAVAAGVDLPALAASWAAGREVKPVERWQTGVQRRALGGELDRLRAALTRRAELPPGVTPWTVLQCAWPLWAPGMRYAKVDPRDPVPMLPARWRDRLGYRGRSGQPKLGSRRTPRHPRAS